MTQKRMPVDFPTHRSRCSLLTAILTVMSACLSVPAVGPSSVVAAPRTAEQRNIDEAIVRALKYLSRQQQPDGSWRIGRTGKSSAATSLAVMAFLAAGHVPGEGPYGKAIERGVHWVLSQQQPLDRRAGREVSILANRRTRGAMYSHGISTLMLAEVAGMLKKKDAKECRKALEKAIRLILLAQNVRKSASQTGGWRYQASSRDSDLSVTGWQLMALRAAKNIGCDVPKESIDKAVAYVKRCRSRFGSGFGYQSGGSPTSTRTGTGILCLEICGQHKTPEAMGAADYLLRRPLRERDSFYYYGVYYCTVGMFKVGGKYWTKTKKHIYGMLLASQNSDPQSAGYGSWIALGSERSYGSVYCTTMSVLALAVEYRYLPIYQR